MNKKIIKNPSKKTTLTTWPGRLEDSNLAIRDMLKPYKYKKPVVYDIGLGWHPEQGGAITTIELKKHLGESATVIGIDRQIPTHIFYNENYGHVLLNKQGEVIGSVNQHMDKHMSFPLSFKPPHEIMLEKTDVNKKKLHDINTSKNGIQVIEGDLFNIGALTDDIPKANLIRVANLFFAHYTGDKIETALKSMYSKLEDDAIVMIGKSKLGLKHSPSLEEYFLYKKTQNKISLDSYMFSVNYLNGDLSLGWGEISSSFNSMAIFYIKEMIKESISYKLLSDNRYNRENLSKIIKEYFNNIAKIRAIRNGNMIQIPFITEQDKLKELSTKWQNKYKLIKETTEHWFDAPLEIKNE